MLKTANQIGKRGSARYDYVPCFVCGRERWVEVRHGKPRSTACRYCRHVARILNKPPADRFWDKVRVGDDCWVWTGGLYEGGYGNFLYYTGKNIGAHRYSWIYHYGEIPQGLQVLHKCDNPPCVNPEHLFLGTHQDNMDDMMAKDRQQHSHGEDHYNSRLTLKQVTDIRKSPLLARELANIYEVSRSHISAIKNLTKWKNQNALAEPFGG